MKNLKLKSVGTNINTITYMVAADDDKWLFASTALGVMPTAVRGEKMTWEEALANVDCMIEYSETNAKFMMKDGTTLELIFPAKMSKQVSMLNSKGVSILECYFKIFTGVEAPPVSKEEFQAQRAAASKIFSEGAKAVGKKKAKSTKKKSSITDTDLVYIMEQIEANFKQGEKFKNKDLASLVEDRFTARQTPSRLKKLVDAGKLESDTASPKNYWLA
ncbi:MAG: hypothetical protein J6A25_03625 [Lachnospiraceae bacterium]|nr:hypothetical protein [Lachnospiraceae bacterium]